MVNNYNDWGWDDVLLAKNKFISIAVVPDAAGRILEFNLGNVPSLWVNPKLFGKSFGTSDKVKMEGWRNFGGYRLVLMPRDNFSVDINGNKAKRWPPPVVIGDAPYQAQINANSNGQKQIVVTSGIQELPVPQYNYPTKEYIYPTKIEERLQYKRSLTIEPNSSIVNINHTLINKGDQTVKRGIMTSSQHVSQSTPTIRDGENYVAYVPFDHSIKMPNGESYEITGTADSRWRYINKNRFALDKNNPDHVKKYYNKGTNWKGEVAPGIYKVEYDYNLMSGLHIIASKPWVCYVNEVNNTAFAKIIEPYNPNLTYDEDVNVSIFCSGLETGYIETEVRTPVYTLAPSESFEYTEIHGAAKIISGPVLDINLSGIITKKLSIDRGGNIISGEYGFFKEGQLVLILNSEKGNKKDEIIIEKVSPLKGFSLKYKLEDVSNVNSVKVYVKEENGKLNLLDSFML